MIDYGPVRNVCRGVRACWFALGAHLDRGLSGMRKAAMAISMCSIAACYTVHNRDMFPVQTAPLDPDRLVALSTHGTIIELQPGMEPSTSNAYRIRIPNPRGTLLLLGGNGNEMEPLIKLATPRAIQLSLDIVILNYWVTGQGQPDTASTSKAVARLLDHIGADSTMPMCVLGHSLGAWFALQAGERPDVSGVVLAAIGTTPAQLTIAQAGFWRPFLWHSVEDDSLRPLDGVALGRRAASPTLIVTSSEDEAIPAQMSTDVFSALPSTLPKRLLVLHGVKHGGYLRSDQFWQAASDYLCRIAG